MRWGDYDRDGRLDLFVSNMDGRCRLFHNEGHGAFRDVAAETGITRTQIGRPFACWFWDFDNDGWLDVFVNNYDCSLAETIADYMGVKLNHRSHPHLFRNLERSSRFLRVLGDIANKGSLVLEPV